MKKILVMIMISLGLNAGTMAVVPVAPILPIPVAIIPFYIAAGGFYDETDACNICCTWTEAGFTGMLEGGYLVNDYISVGVRGTYGNSRGIYGVGRVGTNNLVYNVSAFGGYGYTKSDWNHSTTGLYGASASYSIDAKNSIGVEAVRYNEFTNNVGVYIMHKF